MDKNGMTGFKLSIIYDIIFIAACIWMLWCDYVSVKAVLTYLLVMVGLIAIDRKMSLKKKELENNAIDRILKGRQ